MGHQGDAQCQQDPDWTYELGSTQTPLPLVSFSPTVSPTSLFPFLHFPSHPPFISSFPFPPRYPHIYQHILLTHPTNSPNLLFSIRSTAWCFSPTVNSAQAVTTWPLNYGTLPVVLVSKPSLDIPIMFVVWCSSQVGVIWLGHTLFDWDILIVWLGHISYYYYLAG